MAALLHFHFGEEQAGRRRPTEPLARFPAPPDAVKTCCWSPVVMMRVSAAGAGADDIDAAHQFIGRPSRKCDRRPRARPGRLAESWRVVSVEAALNVIEVQAVRLALALYFVDQLLPELRFGNGLRGGDD